MAIQDAKDKGYDMMILGGQRQRYNYFGFERAGMVYRFSVNAANLRHCLGDRKAGEFAFSDLTEERPDELDFCYDLAMTQIVRGARPRDKFLAIMRSWNSRCRLIRRDGQMFGYVAGREWAVLDEKALPYVMRALMREDHIQEITIAVPVHHTERIRVLSEIAENGFIAGVGMIRVLRWKKVLKTFLKLENTYKPLQDGEAVLRIDSETLKIIVKDGRVSVEDTQDSPDRILTDMEALRLLFGLEQLIQPDAAFHNWLPLPFFISSVDEF